MTDQIATMQAPAILIVDDDQGMRMLMREALEVAGMVVQEVASGEDALEALKSIHVDAVLLDVEMTGIDGYATCRAIRELPNGRQLPVMMVTGHDDEQSINTAYEAGANDFLQKPVSWQLLAHRVRYLTRGGRMRKALEASEVRNRSLLTAVPDTLLVLDNRHRVTQRLGAPGDLFNASVTLIGQPILDLVSEDMRPRLAAALRTGDEQDVVTEFEFVVPSAMGDRVCEGRMVQYGAEKRLVMLRDITEKRRAEAHIRELAFFDRLTGLPNREQLADIFEREIAGRSATEIGCVAMVQMDLDHFQRVNESFGHEIGDGFLCATGKRLEASMTAGVRDQGRALVCRFGGDEFAVLLWALRDTEQVKSLVEQVLASFREPLQQSGRSLVITPTLGVAFHPDHGADLAELMRATGIALHSAKAAGRNRIAYSDGSSSAAMRDHLELAAELRQAVSERKLSVAYQLQYDLRSGKPVAAEALARWTRVSGQSVSPAAFVPIAEESDLIVAMTDLVMSESLAQVKRWRNAGRDLRVAVNLSTAMFTRCRLYDWVMAHLQAADVPPQALEIEITESVLMHGSEQTTGELARLKRSGVHIAVDDFGTGYSSLSYLRKLALNTLKIDRSFVNELVTNSGDAAICGAIIAMAHSLGLEVVAEGIETPLQLAFLRDRGCDMAQGYLLAKPVNASECERMFDKTLLPAGTAIATPQDLNAVLMAR